MALVVGQATPGEDQDMTRMEILQILHTRKQRLAYLGIFEGPTKWFISRSEWLRLPESFGYDEFFVYVGRSGNKNELCGLPVFQVIEDGIFECY